MSLSEWCLVILLNGSIIAYGLYLSRGIRSSTEWFLAGRTLPWWVVGLSMYATAIDASDLVADSGGTYTLGVSFMVTNWVGVVGGWALAAFFLAIPMYRLGMYTNAEYLEARFGPSARIVSVFVQVQFRSLVLAIMSVAIYRTLAVVCGWGSDAWWAVAAIAILATIYTALGGLRSVAITDALQFVVMTIAALLFWSVIWTQVGGWAGMERRFEQAERGLADRMVHVGRDDIDLSDVRGKTPEQIQGRLLAGGEYKEREGVIEQTTPAWLYSLSLIIVGLSYSIVNHTQTMRMLASKSEWDLKMSVVLAGAVMLAMTFFNLSIGVMGRALHPDQTLLPDQSQDSIYPLLISQLTTGILRAIVVSGVLAAAFSTYDSIGSTLSSLLIRDVYARIMVRNAEDTHYRRVGQWLTPLIIGFSFLYVPSLLKGGMLLFYLDLTSAFVVPLLTLYLMGAFTRVHRISGIVGLSVGATYGIVRLLTPSIAEQYGMLILPAFLVNKYGAYIYSMLLTGGAMLLVSAVRGWEQPGALLHKEQDGWLRASQVALQKLEPSERSRSGQLQPALLVMGVVATGLFLSYVLFW